MLTKRSYVACVRSYKHSGLDKICLTVDLTYSDILARRMPERWWVGARTFDGRELNGIHVITVIDRPAHPSQRPSHRIARAGSDETRSRIILADEIRRHFHRHCVIRALKPGQALSLLCIREQIQTRVQLYGVGGEGLCRCRRRWDKRPIQMLWCRWTAGESPAFQPPINTRTNVEQSSATFVINLTELPQRRKERIDVKVPTESMALAINSAQNKNQLKKHYRSNWRERCEEAIL